LRLVLPDSHDQRLPLHVDITDNGPGLPEALAKHVFDPFVSSKSNGKGLGLALVSKIVTQHNAWVSVVSRPGETTFKISLPIKI
jgi:two-component system nitrogen regulation sensor histidine kinase GlnL